MGTNTGTTRFSVTKNAWVKITNGAAGSLFVERGGAVALTEQPSLPATSVVDTPLLEILQVMHSRVYFKLPAGGYIYARAISGDVQMTNTPAA